jgi:hypothetical protein
MADEITNRGRGKNRRPDVKALIFVHDVQEVARWKRKDYGRKEEIGDFLSVDAYTKEMMLEGGREGGEEYCSSSPVFLHFCYTISE